MRTEQKYQSFLVPNQPPEGREGMLPITTPVNDVIALGYTTPGRETAWLADYGPLVAESFGLVADPPAFTMDIVLNWGWGRGPCVESRRVSNWRRGDEPARFVHAARRAANGKLSPDLTKYLARIEFDPRGQVDVPGFLELAAWCLLRTVTGGYYFTVRTCELCKVPFLTHDWSRHGDPGDTHRPLARYCDRLAPDSSQTCTDRAKVLAYQAQRKRITAEKGATRGKHR